MRKKLKIKKIPLNKILKNKNIFNFDEYKDCEQFEIIKAFYKKIYNINITEYLHFYFDMDKNWINNWDNKDDKSCLVIEYK